MSADFQPQVALWGCFEQQFTTALLYDNPFQAASLRVTFTSPSGRESSVDGFWDGGSLWRVRFMPDQTGTWRYHTDCSDTSNIGLYGQSGSFTCTQAAGKTVFEQHGPLKLSSNRRYLSHVDGTPFFWLADTVWNGPLRASQDEWERYLAERARQKFTAVQWVTTQWIGEPKGDAAGALAYTGNEQIEVNPAYFKRMDEKVRAANRCGLLSVPVLLWAAGWSTRDNNWVNPGFSLPEDQAIRFARYIVARWGAYFVAWILPGDADYRGEHAARWQRIGQGVFGNDPHAPVSLHPGGMQWNLDEFQNESWLDIIGYQSGHGDDGPTLAWLNAGPPSTDWAREPARPFINLEPPYEQHLAYQSRQPHDAYSVRRALYWSLLVSPTAGVTYGGHGVWGWDDGSGPPTGHLNTGTPLPWQQALTLPGAEQIQHLAKLFQSIDWWRLRPAPELLAVQPGNLKSEQFVAASCTDNRDLIVIYTPHQGCIDLQLSTIPDDISALWFDPRTGQRQPATLHTMPDSVQAQTPGEGDWVLLLGRNVYLPANSGAGANS
jgi:hypothetical protein